MHNNNILQGLSHLAVLIHVYTVDPWGLLVTYFTQYVTVALKVFQLYLLESKRHWHPLSDSSRGLQLEEKDSLEVGSHFPHIPQCPGRLIHCPAHVELC